MNGAKLTGTGLVELQAMEQRKGEAAFLHILACGVCHSDRKAFNKPPAGMQLPRVLGHELVGELLVDLPRCDLNAGDRVVAWPALVCGRCGFCKSGRENLCGDIQLFGYHLDGGFAEKFFLSPESITRIKLFKIADKISSEAATFCEPLACIINAFRKLSAHPSRLLIVGGGLMGRLAARVAQSAGRAEVFFHDVDQERLEHAMADGRRFDGKECEAVLIAASGEGAVQYGLDNLAPGGTLLLFSGQSPALIKVDHSRIHQQEQTLTGVYGCRIADLEMALSMLQDEELDVDALISRRVTLDEIPTELGKIMNHDDYKVVMVNY